MKLYVEFGVDRWRLGPRPVAAADAVNLCGDCSDLGESGHWLTSQVRLQEDQPGIA